MSLSHLTQFITTTMPASLTQIATGVLCEIFLWQSGVMIANVTGVGQTMEGIGASGAWWPLDLYNYPDSVRQNVSYLLFSNETLGLTSYRYNVGAGGVGVGNPSRAPETTYISATESNFSADPQGAYWLRAAASYGVPQLTAFANSAPPAFTTSNASCGGFLENALVTQYTSYLAGVINYWKTQNVNFAYVSPMNEPDNGFPGTNGSLCPQEGMVVLPTSRAGLVNTLRSTLTSSGLSNVQIQADETSTQIEFLLEADDWLPGAANSLAVVSHHDYLFSDDLGLQLMGDLGRKLSGKGMWFTEICCFQGANGSTDPASGLAYGQGYDPTMLSALQMANLIYRAFTLTEDTHFDWWTALSSEIGCDPVSSPGCESETNGQGWNDGLIYYDPSYASNGNTNLYLTKRYHTLKHFTHAIPLSSTLFVLSPVPSSVRALAFQLPGGQGWSAILINLEGASVTMGLDTTLLGEMTRAYQTTEGADYESLAAGTWGVVCGTVLEVVLPGSSVTSVYFSG